MQKVKIVKTNLGTEYWQKIKAYQACNYDGCLVGWQPGTPAGERVCTERKFVLDDLDLPIKYTNYW